MPCLDVSHKAAAVGEFLVQETELARVVFGGKATVDLAGCDKNSTLVVHLKRRECASSDVALLVFVPLVCVGYAV